LTFIICHLAALGIRAQPSKGAQTDFTNGLNSAILRYVTADDDEPTTPQVTLSLALNESSLIPLGDDPLGSDLAAPGTAEQGGADDVFNIAITFDGANFAINGVTFQSPSVPVLLQILSGAQDPNSLLPSGSVFNINRGDVVEVTVPGGTAGAPVSIYCYFVV
jgi:iron transport multicopper oxidase